jgi:hypothetical protein
VLAGGAEAVKSLGEGVVGLFDVIVKPIEGAAQDGVSGMYLDSSYVLN